MAVKKTKRGIDEWMETIDTIFNDDELRYEFVNISQKKRDEVYNWAKKHGFKHWMILRLAKEYSIFIHYESIRTEFFRNYDEDNKVIKGIPSERKYLGSFVLKQEVKQIFFMEDKSC